MAMILKTVGPERGAHWVRDGMRLYLRRPLAFTAMFIGFMFVALFSALLPWVGGLVQIALVPLLSLGLMIASQSALLGGSVGPTQFFEPFRGAPSRRRALVLLCLVYAAAVVVVLWLADWVADDAFSRLMELIRTNAPPAEVDALFAERPIVTGALFGTAALTLVTVPFWHAPALVHWAGQGALQALFSSTLAVWRCRGAFFVYALAWFALFVLTAVAMALVFGLLGLRQFGVLFAVPVGLFFSTLFYVSLIFTFNDSFGGAPEAPLPLPEEPPPALH